jgi:hypothetical protein
MDYYNTTGIYDNSTYKNFGKFEGRLSASNLTASKFGNGLKFGEFGLTNIGLNAGNRSSLSFGTGNFTISLWFNISSTGQDIYNGLLYHGGGDSSSAGYTLFLTSGGIRYDVSDGAGNWYEPVGGFGDDLRDNTFHHLVWTYNGTYNGFYVDSVPLFADAWNYGTGNPTVNLLIGEIWTGSLNGTMDELIMMNRSITNTEILSLYNSQVNKFDTSSRTLANGRYNYTVYAVNTAGERYNSSLRYFTVEDAPVSGENKIYLLGTNNRLIIAGTNSRLELKS